MLMPTTTQEKPCAPVISETNPATQKQSAHFHSWSIAMLPTELLLQITGYLSLNDACNLALVSRRMYSVLDEYGLFEVVRHYGRLRKNEQQFYRNLSITNPQLIHHLRTSKIHVIAGQSRCTENLPAICAFHTYHLRHETINAISLNFSLKSTFGREDNITDHYLNKNHSRLIINDRNNCQFSIWSAGNDGSWNREFTIERDYLFNCYNSIDRYHGNTIFLPADSPTLHRPLFQQYGAKDALLSVSQRDERGFWTETQRLTVHELFPEVCGDQRFEFITLSCQASPDGKSLIYTGTPGRSVILGRELNGQWAIKGNCSLSYTTNFSPDSNHIAVNNETDVQFYGKQKDGSWSVTGMLEFKMYAMDLTETDIVREYFSFDTIAFSPDSQHFVACFTDAGENSDNIAIHVENFFVVVFSLGDNGQWSEAIKIIQRQSPPTQYTSLEATFSPDSKYLVVHGESGFDIWHFTDDNRWVPAIKDHAYYQKSRGLLPHSTVTFNTESSVFVLFRCGAAMVWQLNKHGAWGCQHSFTYPYNRRLYRSYENGTVPAIQKFSPDGSSIICTDERGRLDIQVQKQDGEWTRQTPDADLRICKLVFSQGGYLLAGVTVDDKSCLIVLGVTPNGTWQEKGRLQAEGHITHINFSPCGRSIQVSSMDGNQKILSFWQIEPEEPGRQQTMNLSDSSC